MVVELLDEHININAVNHAGLLDGFAAGSGAAETMHTHFKEVGGRCAVNIKNITDNGIFCNFGHVKIHPFNKV